MAKQIMENTNCSIENLSSRARLYIHTKNIKLRAITQSVPLFSSPFKYVKEPKTKTCSHVVAGSQTVSYLPSLNIMYVHFYTCKLEKLVTQRSILLINC